MDLLARRDHSERELRQKLSKHFSTELIDQAIEHFKERGWLPNTQEQTLELSQKVAGSLHRKKKGLLYINQYLQQKGLPPIAMDESLELEKANALVKNKLAKAQDRDKLGRFLKSRGFDNSTIRKVIYQK